MPDENGEPWGYELIHGTGSITTLGLDEEYDVEERRFPFGFCYQPAPPPRPEIKPPTLTSEAWAAWLDAH